MGKCNRKIGQSDNWKIGKSEDQFTDNWVVYNQMDLWNLTRILAIQKKISLSCCKTTDKEGCCLCFNKRYILPLQGFGNN